MRKRSPLAIVVMLAAATALTACVSGAGPSASPSPSATFSAMPSPMPSPTPDVPVAASVAISAETIAVLDSAGAPIVSFDYFQPTADVVAGLCEHLGAGVGSTGGVHVGGALSGVTIGAEPPVAILDSTDGRPLAYVRVGLVPLPPGGEYGDAPNLGITIVGYTDTDTVDRFIAPSRNWGP